MLHIYIYIYDISRLRVNRRIVASIDFWVSPLPKLKSSFSSLSRANKLLETLIDMRDIIDSIFNGSYCHFNPLAYTAACEAAGLAKSINTQPAVRRNSETNPTSQHNRGMY